MSTNAEQRLQQQVDELMIRLAASEEALNNLIAELDRANYTTMVAVERAEAAEQRIKASQEQEPVKAIGKTYGVDGNYTFQADTKHLYKQPIIQPELSEVVRERDELRKKLEKYER